MTFSPDYVSGFSAAKSAALAAVNGLPVPAASPVPPAPAILSPMRFGTNLEANVAWQNSAPWGDLAKQMTGWYGANGGQLAYDEFGYPSAVTGPAGAAAQCHTWIYNYPAGTYTIRYHCAAGVQVSIVSRTINGLTQLPDGSWQGTFPISAWDVGNPDGQNRGSGLCLTISATGAIGNLQILAPDAAPGQSFRPDFINRLKSSGYGMLRLMPWCRVNYGASDPIPPTAWANRVAPTGFDQTTHGPAYEFMAELSRITGLAVWVNMPFDADDDYLARAARIFQGVQSVWERGNENWNTGNGYQGNAINATAMGIPALNAAARGNPAVAGAMYYAQQTAAMGKLVRGALGPACKIVLGVQAAWDQAAKSGLSAIQPGDVDWVAVAPYFQPDQWSAAANPETILQACQRFIAGTLVTGMTANAADAAAYGAELVTYEGGQSLMPNTAVNVFRQGNVFQQSQVLADPAVQAQDHPMMSLCYAQVIELCRRLGVQWFVHFLLWGYVGKSGCWPVKQNPGDPENAKSYALAAGMAGMI